MADVKGPKQSYDVELSYGVTFSAKVEARSQEEAVLLVDEQFKAQASVDVLELVDASAAVGE